MKPIVLRQSLLCCVLLATGWNVYAQISPDRPPSQSELDQIAGRGRSLAEYDAAAWHASDAVEALNPPKTLVRSYVARKDQSGWVVCFGRFNEANTKFLIAYEARQTDKIDEYRVVQHDPPVEDGDFYFRAARALTLGKGEFTRDLQPQRPYNLSILPAPSDQWYFYAIPGQTDASVLPYGGDIRYTISSDASSILEKRRMHKTVLEMQLGPEPHLFGFHTHFLSDIPEDSDVFYAEAAKASAGDFVATRKFFYLAKPDGTLAFVGPTTEVVSRLEKDTLEGIPAEATPMMLSTLRRLLDPESSAGQIEVVPAYTGARCANSTLLLKFSLTVHNISDSKLVLYKNPLEDSQVRFAATIEDLKSGKYEKLGFITPTIADFSRNDSYIELSPGMAYRDDREFPILGLDLLNKSAVQFVFFTWPLDAKQKATAAKKRFTGPAKLFTDDVVTDPVSFNVDQPLLKQCTAK